ncbi:hypothetical protein [Nocardiopsis sp. CNR-923]|uniref:hypothetical protein n=1 Tax=Nocardiopsis sp. CNR-923 TaxID=1904965 RepID=UPI00130132C3|nr:hypothetical protein [Nocardiopsis sp. CNR-923]
MHDHDSRPTGVRECARHGKNDFPVADVERAGRLVDHERLGTLGQDLGRRDPGAGTGGPRHTRCAGARPSGRDAGVWEHAYFMSSS